MKKYFIIIALFFCTAVSQSQNVIEISPNLDFKSIEHEFIEIFVDTTNQLTYEDINNHYVNRFDSFVDYSKVLLKENTHWFRFTIKNSSDELFDWALVVRDFQYINVYIIDKNNNIKHLKTGDLVPVKEKQIKAGIISSIKFYLLPNQTKTFYLQARSEIDLPILNTITIINSETFIRKTAIDNLLQGIFHGLLWLMLLYNLFLYIITKQRSYLYYIIYVFSFSMVTFYAQYYFQNFIFPNKPKISAYFGAFLYVAFTSYFLLMREFIDAPKKHKKFDKFLKIVIGTNAIITLLIVVAVFFNPSNFTLIGLYYVMLNSIALVICVIIILIKGNKIAKLFAFGTMFLALCIAIATGLTIAELESDNLMLLFQTGIVGEVFIFSIGLSYKYKTAEDTKRKAQADFISQLKENEKIKDEANILLEQKVIERTKELNEEKIKVEKKNKHITDSINYARRIQQALLPSKKAFKEYLPNHFILYKPKDIVSGDFYYLNKQEDKIIIAAVDCTGHGVPGAFVSMLGIAFLNEILAKYEINSASQILDRLRILVKSSLQQTQKKSKSKDGMDIALCLINTKTNNFQYSGAYNPLYIIRNKKLTEIKATRNPIGVYIKEQKFINNSFEIQKGDKFYIFSDGFADQFGEKENKKYLTKNFKKLLQAISEKSFATQKTILNNTIEDWQGNNEQNDDILVIGFEINNKKDKTHNTHIS